MIVAPPLSGNEPLQNRIQPSGWQHLGGPFKWYEFVTGELEVAENGGYFLRVRILNTPVGLLVQSILRAGREVPKKGIPVQTMLLSGPGGIGKSAFEVLLARTKWSEKKLQPICEYITGGDGEPLPYYFVDEATNEVIVLNPEESRTNNHQLFNQYIQDPLMAKPSGIYSFNSTDVDKGKFSEIIRNLQRARAPNRAHIVVMKEFDNMISTQVASMKDGLDANGISEIVLFMADTNHYDKVIKVCSPAAMQRFQQNLRFGAWSVLDLQYVALQYIGLLNLSVDLERFQTYEKAALELAQNANGAFRTLIFQLSQIESTGRVITPELVASLTLAGQGEVSDESYKLFDRFIRTCVQSDPSQTLKWIKQFRQTNLPLIFLIERLMRHAFDRGAVLEDPNASYALSQLLQIVRQSDDGQPMPAVAWQAAGPLLLVVVTEIHRLLAR